MVGSDNSRPRFGERVLPACICGGLVLGLVPGCVPVPELLRLVLWVPVTVAWLLLWCFLPFLARRLRRTGGAPWLTAEGYACAQWGLRGLAIIGGVAVVAFAEGWTAQILAWADLPYRHILVDTYGESLHVGPERQIDPLTEAGEAVLWLSDVLLFALACGVPALTWRQAPTLD